MTQWWLDMGVLGESRDDCDINRVKSVTALKNKAALSDVKGWKMALF